LIREIDAWAHANARRERPAENLLLTGGLLLLALLLPPWPGAPFVAGSALAVALGGARIPPIALGRALLLPFSFLFVGMVPLLVSIAPAPDAGWRMVFAAEGLETALATALRAVAAFTALILLAMTTPVGRILALLGRAGLPIELIETMRLTYKMLFILDEEMRRMIAAQTARSGYRGIRRSFHSAGLAVAALLRRTLHRSRAMARGEAARNYRLASLPTAGSEPLAPGRLALVATLLVLIVTTTLILG
jgi:cobalt/nickel transport system permease protein